MLSRITAQGLGSKAPGFSSKCFLKTARENLHTTSHVEQTPKGQGYPKQPVKLMMEKGKTYNWCACGLSRKQPFCDGSHKNSPSGIKPMPFTPNASKEYEICNCKQSDQRPLCDGVQCKK